MADYDKEIKKLLVKNGCVLVRRGKGGHSIWYSPITGVHFTVDGTIKSRFTANAALKQAGINKKF